MTDNKRLLVQSWLAKALHDLHSARVLASGSEPILDTAIFHCQHGVLPAHTHPVDGLAH